TGTTGSRSAAATGTAGARRSATAAEAAEPDSTTTAANIHAADIALTHHGVPGGLGHAVLVGVDSGNVDDGGMGDAGDGAVLVLERRCLVDGIAVIVVAPPVVDRREIHRLGVDEFRALYGVVGAHPEAGEHQVGDRPRLAGGVVLVVHEGVIIQFVMV